MPDMRRLPRSGREGGNGGLPANIRLEDHELARWKLGQRSLRVLEMAGPREEPGRHEWKLARVSRSR